MRILWSYFVDENKLGWNRFYEKFSECFDSLSTLKAIDSIILHSGKSVLLCVDETMKLYSLDNIMEMLKELYIPYHELATKDKKFYFVISTLDSLNVWNAEKGSQRPIKWIPLRGLGLLESANLFRKFLKNLEDRLHTLRKIISDCNGHPRTLETFHGILDDTITLETDQYASLAGRLAINLESTLGRISLPIVRMALLRNKTSLTCKIETSAGTSTLKELISSGMYINSLTSVNETFSVVPTLSPIALQCFCVSDISKESENASNIAEILKRLLTEEFLFEREVLDGKPFERFHQNWEVLYRAIRENNTIVSLNNIYGFPIEYKKGTVEIKLQRKTIAYCHDKPFKNLVDFLFVPRKSNNSGFDMITFEEKADGSGYIAINIECRFSYPDKTTKFKDSDIR